MLLVYGEIGNTILEQQKLEGLGAKITDKLATDLLLEFTDFKGLSARNLNLCGLLLKPTQIFHIVQLCNKMLHNYKTQKYSLLHEVA